MRVCIDGTFNQLHKGNKKLINTAIQRAGEDGFFIGLSSGELISGKPFLKRFETRRTILLDFF